MLILCAEYFCGGFFFTKIRVKKLEKEKEIFSEIIEANKAKANKCYEEGNSFGNKHYLICANEAKERLNNIDYNLGKCKIQIKKYSLVKPYIKSKVTL